jgi:hypothetical protein
MKYAIHGCSTLTTFKNIKRGQLFVRSEDEDTLYLKGGGTFVERYINLKTGEVLPADFYNSAEMPDLVFPVTDYELTAYLSKEV